MKDFTDLAPGLRHVVSDRPLEVGGAQEAGPSLIADRSAPVRAGHRRRERQRHVGVAEELALGLALEGQRVGRDQQPVAQLRDAEPMIRQRLGVIEEGPTRRADLVVVALRRGIHAELRRAVAEAIAAPIAEPAFDGLEHAVPSRSALLPSARERAFRRERTILVVGVVGQDPTACEPDLEMRERLIDQRPCGGVETHAVAVLCTVRRLTRAVADVAVQAAPALLRRRVLRGAGEKDECEEDQHG